MSQIPRSPLQVQQHGGNEQLSRLRQMNVGSIKADDVQDAIDLTELDKATLDADYPKRKKELQIVAKNLDAEYEAKSKLLADRMAQLKSKTQG